MLCEVPVFTRPLIGSPVNFADCLIGSPISSRSTGEAGVPFLLGLAALTQSQWLLQESGRPVAAPENCGGNPGAAGAGKKALEP